MSSPPFVSIIIPCFNQGRYVAEAIDSVLAQTYHNYELILVDDGSTDETAEVLAQAKARHNDRVHTVHQTNQGVSMARQAGLDRASGDYLVFLDSDDRLMPKMLDDCLAGFRRWPSAGGIVGCTRLVYENKHSEDKIMRYGKNARWPEVLAANPFGAICSMMLKRRDVLEVGGVGRPGVRASEDWDLHARMIRRGKRFKGIPQVLSRYLQHEGVLSRDIDLMLHAKIAMLDRFAQRDSPVNRDYSKLSAQLYGRYRNGYVLFAMGQAVGRRFDEKALDRLIKHMIQGDFHYRYFCNQFLYGLQHSVSVTHAELDCDYIKAVCTMVLDRFLFFGFERYVSMYLNEIRREMKNPMTKRSLARRISRLLDPTRRFWFLSGAESPREPPCRGRGTNEGEDQIHRTHEKP